MHPYLTLAYPTVRLGQRVNEKLIQYQVETEWNKIKLKSKGEWKKVVEEADDKVNKEEILNNCTTETPQQQRLRQKHDTLITE